MWVDREDTKPHSKFDDTNDTKPHKFSENT